jgi:hypothetical protein
MTQNFLRFVLRFPFLHNLLQRVDVLSKRRPAFRSQCVSRLRPTPEFLGDGHQTLLVQRAHVRDQIAVAHLQFGFELLERPASTRGEQCHNRQPPLFVDDLVEFLEVEHRSFEGKLFDFVRAFPWPGTHCINQMIHPECDAHGNVRQIRGEIADRVSQRR